MARDEVTATSPRTRMRRDIAAGMSVPDAVTKHSAVGAPAGKRAEDWLSLRAGQLGMNTRLLNLLATPGVTDVLINGTQIWVDRGRGCERVEGDFPDVAHVRRLAVQMAAAAGKRLDDSAPLVDGFLGDTIRMHAVLAPLAKEGPVISLRVLRPGGMTLDDLVDLGTLSEGLVKILRQAVAARVSMLISGATGAGKTTLLGALLMEVPQDQRIVCIEEVTELLVDHPHLVHLQERQANVEGSGAVTLSELVRASLRMRPDRLVLGECRGPEIKEVLSAMNTGHTGGFTTIHANRMDAVPARLIALGALAGLNEDALEKQGSTAFQMVVHVVRGSDGKRRLSEVGVFADQKAIEVTPAWHWNGSAYVTGPGALLFPAILEEFRGT